MEATPASLLYRLREPSNDEAWRRFVNIYTPLLYRWAERWGLQSQDAADLVQEVFVVLLQSLPKFDYDPQRSFRAWLHTVVRTKWCDWHRRRGRVVVDDAGLSGVESTPEWAAREEAEFRSHVIGRTLQLLAEEFGPTTIAAFRATAIEGRSASDVAAELELTENAVYLARGRVMRRLRMELEGMWN